MTPAQAASPAGIVLTMLHVVAEGDYPQAPVFYDNRVQCAMGTAVLAEVLNGVRPDLLGATPRVLGQQAIDGGELVSVEFPQLVVGRLQHSFFLTRQHGRWLITFDTLTDAALSPYVEGAVQNEVAPGAAAASPEALRDAAEATDRYEALILGVAPRVAAGLPASSLPGVIKPAARSLPSPACAGTGSAGRTARSKRRPAGSA